MASNKTNKSPLRYPGGKTRACNILEQVLLENFDVNNLDNIISPFFGGGSFEFYIQNKYDLKIICNDKFTVLYNFWNICSSNKQELYDILIKKLNNIDKNIFLEYRSNILQEQDKIIQASKYFVINRCSFSGATMSGGFSPEASKKRFTSKSVELVKKLDLSDFDIYNLDYRDFLDKILVNNRSSIIFLDPPYYLDKKSKLYGVKGDLHENFDHDKLQEYLVKISGDYNWIMTYNNCDYIRKLYDKFKILDIKWSYSMNKTKKSSEIVIINHIS